MKGSWYVCVGSVKNWIFNAEHIYVIFLGLRLYHQTSRLLTEAQINCSCGDWFNDYDDPCLSGPDLRQTVHFYATKELKDPLWWALACAASRQMPSGQAPVPSCNAFESSEVSKPDNSINVVCIKRNNTVKQKDKRQPRAVAKSKRTDGEKSVSGGQLGRADLWAIHQERNKDKQLEIWDIKKPESGFAWWHLIAVSSHSEAFLQSTKTRRLTNCLSRSLPKAVLQQEAPAPRKLQRRLLIFILQVCSVFTHIRLLLLGNLLPPPLFPAHTEWHKPSAERTLPSGQPWPRGTGIIVAIKAMLVHAHTNVQKHWLLTALTNKEAGYGNEEWNRWLLDGHTFSPSWALLSKI